VFDLTRLTWTLLGGSAVEAGKLGEVPFPNKFVKIGKSWDPDEGSSPSVRDWLYVCSIDPTAFPRGAK